MADGRDADSFFVEVAEGFIDRLSALVVGVGVGVGLDRGVGAGVGLVVVAETFFSWSGVIGWLVTLASPFPSVAILLPRLVSTDSSV